MATSSSGGSNSPTVNPLVQDLLAQQHDQVLMIGGFVGPSSNDHIRLYEDLSLSKYIDIAKADIVRAVETPDKPDQPCIVFFRSTAQLRYTQTMTVKADQALTAWLSRPPRCACGGRTGLAAAQQDTGGGPIVDLCEWSCIERGSICWSQGGIWHRFWCIVDYFSCRLGCGGPIIV
jgi:hypothetical protein